MIIFSLLVLILFFPINGMIIEQDPYLPEVQDNYKIKIVVSDGCLIVPQEKLDKLYLGNMVSDQAECFGLDLKRSEVDLTKKTFSQDQKYTVGNVSQAIHYLNGKKNLLDLSVEQRCELLRCADSLASDGAHKKVIDLAAMLYKDVQKGSVDEETQRLVSSIFNTNSKIPYKTNGYLVRMINITGRPTAVDRTMIACLIKNTPYLSLLKVNGFFMPVLPKGTLTNPTPPNGCTIDLSNNEISEIEPGAVEWWNKGQLILNNNPLTEESIKRLQQDTRMPLSKHLANSKSGFFQMYSSSTYVFLASCLPVGGLVTLAVQDSDLYYREKILKLLFLSILGAVSMSHVRDILNSDYRLCQKKYFPLKLVLGNTAEYKPIFDVPLD